MSDNGFVSIKPDVRLIRPTRWLWRNRIAKGGLALLIGNEEVGKGFFACYLMSMLTHGNLPGYFYRKPIRVEIVAYEDSIGEWTKRMDAAQADEDMWTILGREDNTILDFQEHLPDLIAHWKKERVRFVYIDQLDDHIGTATDSYNNKQVRQALIPLHYNLDRAGITALATGQPNKRGESVRQKVNGSIAKLAVVRSAAYIGVHPSDEATRVVVPIKNNRGPKEGSLEFEIVDTPPDYKPNGRYIKCGVIETLTPSKITFEDLSTQTRKAQLDAQLLLALGDHKWHWFSDLRTEFSEVDYSFNVMKRAARRLGVVVEQKGFPARARWKLP